MKAKHVLLLVVIAVSLTGGIAYLVMRPSAKASDVPPIQSCVAANGEICPSSEMAAEIAQDVAVQTAIHSKNLELMKTSDVAVLESMSNEKTALTSKLQAYEADLQGKINDVLQKNPGHRWDNTALKFVPAVPVTSGLPPAPADQPKKK